VQEYLATNISEEEAQLNKDLRSDAVGVNAAQRDEKRWEEERGRKARDTEGLGRDEREWDNAFHRYEDCNVLQKWHLSAEKETPLLHQRQTRAEGLTVRPRDSSRGRVHEYLRTDG